jgi:hypothetical protein
MPLSAAFTCAIEPEMMTLAVPLLVMVAPPPVDCVDHSVGGRHHGRQRAAVLRRRRVIELPVPCREHAGAYRAATVCAPGTVFTGGRLPAAEATVSVTVSTSLATPSVVTHRECDDAAGVRAQAGTLMPRQGRVDVRDGRAEDRDVRRAVVYRLAPTPVVSRQRAGGNRQGGRTGAVAVRIVDRDCVAVRDRRRRAPCRTPRSARPARCSPAGYCPSCRCRH